MNSNTQLKQTLAASLGPQNEDPSQQAEIIRKITKEGSSSGSMKAQRQKYARGYGRASMGPYVDDEASASLRLSTSGLSGNGVNEAPNINKQYDQDNLGVDKIREHSVNATEITASANSGTDDSGTKYTLNIKSSQQANKGLKKQTSRVCEQLISEVTGKESLFSGATSFSSKGVPNFGNRRNPISEGPTTAIAAAAAALKKSSAVDKQLQYQQALRQRRSTAVQRKVTDQNQSTSNSASKDQGAQGGARNRIFSSDLIEIQERKIKQAKEFHRTAQHHYSNNDYFDCLTYLEKAVKIFKVQQLDEQMMKENQQVYKIIKDCYLFSASCYIKINQYESAIQLMNELLEIEPHNMKALYLRGKAHYSLNNIAKAYNDFMYALEIDPQNQTLISYLNQISDQHPNIELQQAGQMRHRSSQQLIGSDRDKTLLGSNSPIQLPGVQRDSGFTTSNTTAATINGISQPFSAGPQYINNKSTFKSKFHSTNSTNANSGSEGGYQSLEHTQILSTVDNEKHIRISNASSNGKKLKKENSIMHPSSPSKIQMDCAQDGNNFSHNFDSAAARISDNSKRSNESVNSGSQQKNGRNSFKDSESELSSSILFFIKRIWNQHKGTLYGFQRHFQCSLSLQQQNELFRK